MSPAGSIAYLDTSAFVKLVVDEPESAALREALAQWPVRSSATLLRVESVRALRRAGYGSSVGAARRLFDGIHFVHLDERLLDRAGELDPSELRSLDAVHLAAALAVGPELEVVVTYDQRLAAAAGLIGLVAAAPT